MDSWGQPTRRDLGTEALPSYSFRELTSTGTFALKAGWGGVSSRKAALGFTVSGVAQGYFNGDGQFLAGAYVDLPTTYKSIFNGNSVTYQGSASTYNLGTSDASTRGFHINVAGSEYAAFTCSNSDIQITGVNGTLLWLINLQSQTMYPATPNQADLGSGANAIRGIYLLNSPGVISDTNFSSNQRSLNSAEITAWGLVSPVLFNQVGQTILSASLIGQLIEFAFSQQSLDIANYNLVYKFQKGGFTQYGIRLDECFVFEMAYQRSVNPRVKREALTVTASNTLSALSQNYVSANGYAEIIVNGIVYSSYSSKVPFTISNKTVTWSATNSGYSLKTTDDVVIRYTY